MNQVDELFLVVLFHDVFTVSVIVALRAQKFPLELHSQFQPVLLNFHILQHPHRTMLQLNLRKTHA